MPDPAPKFTAYVNTAPPAGTLNAVLVTDVPDVTDTTGTVVGVVLTICAAVAE
jgi:hypothetical protein